MLDLTDIEEALQNAKKNYAKTSYGNVKNKEALGAPNPFKVSSEHDKKPHIEKNMQKVIGAVHKEMRNNLIGLKERRVEIMRA
jgi:hypothetical protein